MQRIGGGGKFPRALPNTITYFYYMYHILLEGTSDAGEYIYIYPRQSGKKWARNKKINNNSIEKFGRKQYSIAYRHTWQTNRMRHQQSQTIQHWFMSMIISLLHCQMRKAFVQPIFIIDEAMCTTKLYVSAINPHVCFSNVVHNCSRRERRERDRACPPGP